MPLFSQVKESAKILTSMVIGIGGTGVYGITGYNFGTRIVSAFDNRALTITSASSFSCIGAISKIGLNVVDVYYFIDRGEQWLVLRYKNDVNKSKLNLLIIPGCLISALAAISITHIAYKDFLVYSEFLAISCAITTALTRVSIGTKSITDILQDVPGAISTLKKNCLTKDTVIFGSLIMTGLISSTIYFRDGYLGAGLLFGNANNNATQDFYYILAAFSCLPTGLLQGKSMILALSALREKGKDGISLFKILMGILGLLSTSFVCEVALESMPGIFKYLVLPFTVVGAATANTRGLIELKELLYKQFQKQRYTQLENTPPSAVEAQVVGVNSSLLPLEENIHNDLGPVQDKKVSNFYGSMWQKTDPKVPQLQHTHRCAIL